MEKKNNNKFIIILLIIIIVILSVLCVLFATGKISYMTSNNTVVEEKNNDNESVDTNTIKHAEWVQYLIDFEDLKVTLTKYYDDDPSTGVETKRILSSEEAVEYLDNLSKCEITNKVNVCGFGGPEQYTTSLKYSNYDSHISYSGLIFVNNINDSKFISILDSMYPNKQDGNCSDENSGEQIFDIDSECYENVIANYFN